MLRKSGVVLVADSPRLPKLLLDEVDWRNSFTVTEHSVPSIHDASDANLDELALAYVLSIHNSQGSEFPCVVIPLHTQHYLLLERNLLYTAVTRGKRLVVVVGTNRALSLAIRRADTGQRHTALRARLQAATNNPG